MSVGEHLIGVPIGAVREVVPPRPFTPLPGTTEWVCGLVNLRGRLVTVIDLAARLGLPPAAARAEHSIVIVQHGHRQVGMAVDDVHRVVQVDRARLEAVGEALRGVRLDRAYLRGVGEVGDRVFVAVDPDELLKPVFA